MFVILSQVNDIDQRCAEALVPILRTYWGQRGIAVHHMSYDQTAKEAALAASYHLRNNNEDIFGMNGEPIPEGLADAIFCWASLEVDPAAWMKVLAARAARETAAWRENDLNHIIILTGVTTTKAAAWATKYLGKNMHLAISRNSLDAHLVTPEELTKEWIERAATFIVKEYQKRSQAGFEGW